VSATETAAIRRATPRTTSAAKARIISAALELFARHGVGGTSLQMIADGIGVTKAAVYHQFKTKDEIVLAAAEAELARLEVVIGAAEAQTSQRRARDALVAGIVDIAVVHRRTASTILNDPLVLGYFAKHQPLRQVMDRLCRVLMGDDIGHEARVSTAMLTAAISGAVIHPLVAGLDDDTLRSELLKLTRRLLPTVRLSPGAQ
jgi:AcrR family transcriptional regulator